jgi:hypothetical protein
MTDNRYKKDRRPTKISVHNTLSPEDLQETRPGPISFRLLLFFHVPID